jgi:hypothetical protein
MIEIKDIRCVSAGPYATISIAIGDAAVELDLNTVFYHASTAQPMTHSEIADMLERLASEVRMGGT